jgi:hypothetical protein
MAHSAADVLIRLRLEQFEYLVRLRNSGATNMFGAAPYLVDEFGLSEKDARAVLVEWIKSFDLPEDEMPKDGR